MAKARIVYVVDDKQLDALQKQLKEIKKQNESINDEGVNLEPSAKKSTGALTDLKGAIAGLGITAVVGAAIVSFAKLTEEINKNRKAVALLTGETGKGLDIITAKASAAARVFDKDFNEVLRAANAVSQNLGISMTDTMDQINDAMARGLDVNGEYLETISEYGPFMKQAGIDFQQFNVLIQKQLTDGVFSDKGIDAIKEAVLSIQEMTPVTRDALRAAGFNTEQLIREIETGAKTYFEVVQEIGTKLDDVTDPRIRGQILADVFKGAGEDAGEYALSLDEVGTEFKELTEDQQIYIDKQKDLITATERTEAALITLAASTRGVSTTIETLWEQVKGGTLRALNEFIESFIEAETKYNDFKRAITGQGEDVLALVMKDLVDQQRELNEEFDKGIEIIGKGGQFNSFDDLQEKMDLVASKIALVNVETATLIEREKAEAEALALANKLQEENSEAKRLTAEESEKLEKRLNAEAEARRKNNQALIDENESFANRNRILSEAEEGSIQESAIDKITEGVDAEIREKGRLVQEAKDRAEAIKNIEEKAIDERNEIILSSVDGLLEITQGFTELRIQQISQELTALEFARNRELELAEGNAAKKDQINQKFDEKRRALEQKQANTQKQSALFEIAINTAVAIAKALPNIPLSILAGVLGAAQAGFVLAQPVPQFAKATVCKGHVRCWRSRNR
jgi:hypothetical protein